MGTPWAPCAVISRASASSAARLDASFFIITTAATLVPRSSSGVASGAFHDATNGSEAHAQSIRQPLRTSTILETGLIFASPIFETARRAGAIDV
jgi:hypothetical protein